MHFAKSTKSDVSNRKTIQVTGAYAEVLIHLLNVTKKARVAPAYGKVRERCPALKKDRKALVAGCSHNGDWYPGSVPLVARVYVPFPMTFLFLLSNFHHLARSVLIASNHKHTSRCFCVHMCTCVHVYTLTSLRGNLHVCRSTTCLPQELQFW